MLVKAKIKIAKFKFPKNNLKKKIDLDKGYFFSSSCPIKFWCGAVMILKKEKKTHLNEMASVRRKPVRREPDAKSNKSDKEKKRKEKEPIMHDLEIITAC